MKIKTIVTEITQADLTDLLSAALYGSQVFGADYSVEEYRKLDTKSDVDCYEDKMAKLLLAGKYITLSDMYAEDEDEYYGKLQHSFDADNCTMDYFVTLKDVKKGIERALSMGGYEAKCAMDLIDADSCELDQLEAEILLQMIVFGEVIYG